MHDFPLLGIVTRARLRRRTKPEVHGHRGSPLRFPENTLPSFIGAIEAGADFVELDVQVSRDFEPIVSHDPRLASGELIHSLKAREITAHPNLDTVLDLATRFSTVGFNIEIKSYPGHPGYGPPPGELARLVLAAIQGRKLEERVLVQSFDFRVLHAMSGLAPAIELSALWEGSRRVLADIADDAGTRCVSALHTLIESASVRQAHDAGIRVLVWTANGEKAWLKMTTAGVDGIITDDPAGLIQFLRTSRPYDG